MSFVGAYLGYWDLKINSVCTEPEKKEPVWTCYCAFEVYRHTHTYTHTHTLLTNINLSLHFQMSNSAQRCSNKSERRSKQFYRFYLRFSSPTCLACGALGSSTLLYFILVFSCWRCRRTALSFPGLSLVGFLMGGTSVRPISKESYTSTDDRTKR